MCQKRPSAIIISGLDDWFWATHLPQANGIGDVILYRTVGKRVAKSARDSRGTALCCNSLSRLPTGDQSVRQGSVIERQRSRKPQSARGPSKHWPLLWQRSRVSSVIGEGRGNGLLEGSIRLAGACYRNWIPTTVSFKGGAGAEKAYGSH